VISFNLHKIYNQPSATWCAEAKDFSLPLLGAIEDLKKRVKRVEDKLAVNSGNSSTPPSKDPLHSPKKRSMRTKSGKKSGGQVKHKGQGGKLRDDPDHIHEYKVNTCPACDLDMSKGRRINNLPVSSSKS
jgi:hypothetical protein